MLWLNKILGHPGLGYQTLLPLSGSYYTILCNKIRENSHNIDINDICCDEQRKFQTCRSLI